MLLFLPSFIVDSIAIILFLLNVFFIPSIICILGIASYLLPFTFWRQGINWIVQNILVIIWIRINNLIIWLCTKTDFDITGTGTLRRKGKYFLICNHQSWVDILIIYKAFGERVPILVFFLKKQLLWALPIIGWTCWFIGFPYMHRYSKSYLKKHPEKKGRDLETIKQFCQRYKKYPATVISFLEATRFTPEKKQQQRSPYQHLLKPKASSFAFVLSGLSDSLQEIINVTIIYPEKNISFWNFICGKIKKVIVRYEVIPIDENLRGDYLKDRGFRARFQNRLNQLWQEKDKIIEECLNK